MLVIFALVIGGVDLALQSLDVTRQDTESGSLMGFIIGAAINLVLIGLISLKHNWARWIFIILAIMSAFVYFSVIVTELNGDMIGAISSIIQISLNLVAALLLFQRSSSNWVKG